MTTVVVLGLEAESTFIFALVLVAMTGIVMWSLLLKLPFELLVSEGSKTTTLAILLYIGIKVWGVESVIPISAILSMVTVIPSGSRFTKSCPMWVILALENSLFFILGLQIFNVFKQSNYHTQIGWLEVVGILMMWLADRIIKIALALIPGLIHRSPPPLISILLKK